TGATSRRTLRLQGSHLLRRAVPGRFGSHATRDGLRPTPAPQPRRPEDPRFGLFPFRSPLLRESRLISLPPGTEMFQFPGLASRSYPFTPGRRTMTPARFPHSDTRGSKPACGSPRLFAACHVLPRLPAPRHPPRALPRLASPPFLHEKSPDQPTPYNSQGALLRARTFSVRAPLSPEPPLSNNWSPFEAG